MTQGFNPENYVITAVADALALSVATPPAAMITLVLELCLQ